MHVRTAKNNLWLWYKEMALHCANIAKVSTATGKAQKCRYGPSPASAAQL